LLLFNELNTFFTYFAVCVSVSGSTAACPIIARTTIETNNTWTWIEFFRNKTPTNIKTAVCGLILLNLYWQQNYWSQ